MLHKRLLPCRIHTLALAASALVLSGCATITPEPLTSQTLRTASDQQALRQAVDRLLVAGSGPRHGLLLQ